MFAKSLSLALALLLSSFSYGSETSFSNLIAETQADIDMFERDYPILVVDKDEVSYQFAIRGILPNENDSEEIADEKEKKRGSYIIEYVKEQTGTTITIQDALQVEPYITVLKNSAVALPVTSGSFSQLKYKACFVMATLPNSNQRLEVERLLGLTTPDVYGDVGFDQLQETLTYKELAYFSIYHEAGHCLDKTFLPDAVSSFDDSHAIHLSESFAEAFALLMLERKGFRDMAFKRSVLRLIYSRKMGSFFANNPQNGFGNPAYTDGGVIYYLSPVLLATAEWIKWNGPDFESMKLEGLVETAKLIVEDKALHSRSFYAISQFLKGDRDVVEEYRGRAFDLPEFFHRPYLDILHYADYTSYVLSKVFEEGDQPLFNNQTKEEIVGFESLCQALRTGNSNEFFSALEASRLRIQKATAEPEVQRSAQLELNDIFEKLQGECPL